jgi:hypothetical protein
VYLLQEDNQHREFFKTAFMFSEKITYVNFGQRLSIGSVLKFTSSNDFLEKHPNTVVVVMNSDIATDLSLIHIDHLLTPEWSNVLMTISRRRTYIAGESDCAS